MGLRPDPLVHQECTSLCRIDDVFSTLPCRSGRSPNLRLPFAGELEGALADWLGEGLVRRDGGETFDRGLALGSQTVEQTQGLSPLRSPAHSSWQIRRSADLISEVSLISNPVSLPIPGLGF